MKKASFLEKQLQKVFFMIASLYASVYVLAQDTPDANLDVNVTTTKTTEEWYTNPLYLIIGAVVLILLVALIARGGKK